MLKKQHLTLFLKVISVISTLYVLYELSQIFLLGDFSDNEWFSSQLNLIVKVIQNEVFFLLLVLFFVRFNFFLLLAILPFAYFEQDYNFFAQQIHFGLLNWGVYDLISKNSQGISPEYPRIIFFLFVLVFFLVALFFKKFRDFKKIFIYLSGLSIFMTALLFHTMIIKEIDFYRMNTKNVMGFVFNEVINENEINKICQANKLECFVYSLDQQEKIFIDEAISPSVLRLLAYMKEPFLNNMKYKYYGVAHDAGKSRLIGQVPFFLLKNEHWALVATDGINHRNFLTLNQYVFAYLGLASHIVWFFGALFLIYFHDKRFRKKNH